MAKKNRGDLIGWFDLLPHEPVLRLLERTSSTIGIATIIATALALVHPGRAAFEPLTVLDLLGACRLRLVDRVADRLPEVQGLGAGTSARRSSPRRRPIVWHRAIPAII
jgi:hypothetical protein